MDNVAIIIILLPLVLVGSHCQSQGQGQCQGQGTASADNHEEQEQLMAALKQSMELNKELKQYLDQLKPIVEGVHSLCKTISTRSCQCEMPVGNQTTMEDGTENSNTTEDTTELPAEANFTNTHHSPESSLKNTTGPPAEANFTGTHHSQEPSLKVLSVRSDGRVGNHTNVTVYYTAREDHATQWSVRYWVYDVDGLYRTVGQVETIGQWTFAATLNLEYVDVIEYAKMKIYSGAEIVTTKFDIAALQMKGMQDLPEYKAELVDMNLSYLEPPSGDMNLTVTVDKSVVNVSAISYISASIAWMNVTDGGTADKYYDVFHSLNASAMAGHLYTSHWYPAYQPFVSNEHDDVTNDVHKTSLIITIEERVAKQGGILQLTLPWKPNTEHFYFIETIEYGVSVNIISPETYDVYPRNAVGMYDWHNVTLLRQTVPGGPKQCIFCHAVGNPSPDVGIYVTHKDGSKDDLRTDLIRPNAYTTVALLTLSPEDPRSPGNYTCRAQSGSAVMEDSTHLILYTPVTFDPARTGVARNTSKKLVVTCKVSGTVRPRLSLRLNEGYDQDAEQAGFKVTRTDVGKRTSLIKMVMSPPDPSVRTVVCVASTYYVEERRTIQVFPPAN